MNKEERKYQILSIFLVVVIIAVAVFLIVPKYFQDEPEGESDLIDFSNSAWIEESVEARVGFFEKDFFISSAFSYNVRSNRMILTYATQKSVDDVRQHYLLLPEAELVGRNDETSLNIAAEGADHKARIYNYYSPISRVIELELILDSEASREIIRLLEEEFPSSELEDIPGIQDFPRGEIFGGYVRYRYDELDEFAYPFQPIYSRAYFLDGSEAEFFAALEAMNSSYPDFRYDQTQDVYYYRIEESILSISYFSTDVGEQIISISIQFEVSP